ncbi:MAG TPA: hypothetical protein VNF72_07960 [Myxococcota bacterium]|nr:hypothetical protein [Myxococcota bacterium]
MLSVLPLWPAAASEVVQVRVGEHPEFTRVVFELDGRAGYRVERKTGPQGTEFVVTLDASSATRKLSRRSSDVALVDVTGGDHAVARIRLRKGDLALKEMILSNPYRIVLDVMRAEPVVAKAKPAPTQKPVAKAAPSKPAPAPVEKPVADAQKPAAEKVAAEKAAVEKAAAEKAAAEKAAAVKAAAEKAAAEKAAAEKAAAVKAAAEKAAAEKAAAEKVAADKAAAEKVAAEKAAAQKAAAEKTAQAKTASAPTAEPGEKPLMTQDDLAKLVAQGEKKPEALAPNQTIPPVAPPPAVATVEPAKPAPKPEAKPAPSPKPDRTGGASWLENPVWLAGAGGALLCVLAAFFVLRRRRALPNDLDVTAIADAHGDAADADASAATEGTHDESSFAGLFDDDDTSSAPARDVAPPIRMSRTKPSEPTPTGTPLDSLFDDDDAQAEPAHEGAQMSTPTDLPMDRTTSRATAAARGAAAPAAGGDVMRLVQELERRLGALESKLDQANEAREKLERQVAAQSEELRVQRAAIARTQRALRTMSRGDEEKATEPALREETQTKIRPGNL